MCHLYPYKYVKLLWKFFYINNYMDHTFSRSLGVTSMDAMSCYIIINLINDWTWTLLTFYLYYVTELYSSFVYISCLNPASGSNIHRLVKPSNVRPSAQAVSTFSKPRDRWADVDETWRVQSTGPGNKRLGNRILNFCSCAARGHPEGPNLSRSGKMTRSVWGAYCSCCHVCHSFACNHLQYQTVKCIFNWMSSVSDFNIVKCLS